MKRLLAISMAMVLCLVMVSGVSAAGGSVTPQQLPFYQVGGSSDSVSATLSGGKVEIVNPMGSVALNITGNVTSSAKLDPNTGYVVWVRDLKGYTGPSIYSAPSAGYYALTTFTTDSEGSGSFHVSISKADLPDGPYQIQVALNPAETPFWPTVVATAWPVAPITVSSH